jgi:nitrogen regulatory protein P-II 1
MKKIEAVIRPEVFEIVRGDLHDAGYHGLTAVHATGYGEQKGVTRIWRGRSFTTDAVSRIIMELVVPDAEADKAMQIIMENARTGQPGDGRIYITDIGTTVHIRSGSVHTGVEEEKGI